MPQVTDVDEIDLKELLAIFWRRRLVIAAFAAIVAIAALGLALILPKKYSASTLLIPVQGHSSGLGAGGSLISRYQGLASLVGISAPGSEKAEESIALLKSTLITEKFLRQENLLPILYSSRWNIAKKAWRHGAAAPTLWRASQYFEKKIRHVARDSKTGLVKLSIEWKNPKQAADWANALVRLTNNYARGKAIARARRDIAFLNSQATKTPYVEERQGIFSIMQAELTNEMLAKGSEEYALKVIDPAFAPEMPVFPRPLLWSVLALFLGAAIGCVYVLIRHRAAESSTSASQGIAATGAMIEHAEKPISPRLPS